MRAALCRVLRAEAHELSALAWAFAYFFLLLCSYYLLRPVRDALAVVPAFGWLCARLSRARLLPLVYAFFALNLLLFSVRLDAALFFIWLSVFNLFVVSVFWSFMSDLFNSAQAARLYGSIAAGGSCGAIAGPLIAAGTVSKVGLTGLLLISAALLALTIVCIVMLGRWARAHPRAGDPPPDAPIGGSIFAGVRAALSSPFLLGICGYLLCYSALSTALYFAQVDIVRDAGHDAGAVARRLPVARRGAGARRADRLRGRAPHRGILDLEAGARRALHRRPARGALQSEEFHRHGDLPRRRHAFGLAAGRRAGACLRGRGDFRRLDRARLFSGR